MTPVAASPSADPASPPLDDDAITRLRLAIARLYRQMVQSGSGKDLTFAQLSALVRIAEHRTIRLGELAALECVAAPSLTRTLAALTYSGLIERKADPSDGRSYLVTVTPAGRDLLARVRQERSEFFASRVSHLTREQQEVLRAAVPMLELLLMEPRSALRTDQSG